MEPLVGWPTLLGQEEGLQGVVSGASLGEGVAGRVDQARSGRRHGGDGSRKLVRVEGSDPRPHEAVGAQCRGDGRRQEGHGGACEQFSHGQEEMSLPRWITPCRALDDAPSRLAEFCRQLAIVSATRGRTLSRSLVERLLCRVRSSGAAPLAWQHSSAAPLHKSNKAGPKGKRVVHALPSVGKQFFKVLLMTKRDMWSPPAPADWLRGHIPGRRRESSVLVRQVTTWSLERLGLKSLAAFHDLTNAFGSVKWEAMDRAAAALLGPNSLLRQQRYRPASTTIPGKDGDVTLKIGEGGLMGDPMMVGSVLGGVPPVDGSLAASGGRRGAERGHMLAWYPWSGGRMDLSLSQYADDTTKQIVAEPGEDVQALAKRVRCSNDVFAGALAADGFSQNRGKEELLMHLVGAGSCADRRLVRDGKVSLPGKVVTVARHLGSHLGEKASFAHELPSGGKPR